MHGLGPCIRLQSPTNSLEPISQSSRRMPPPVRRKIFVLVVALGAVLVLSSVAYAGNGGFAPPTPHSPNAKRINDSYVWISIFTGAIFVLVEGALILFIVKYRRRGRPRTAEGPQIHGAA